MASPVDLGPLRAALEMTLMACRYSCAHCHQCAADAARRAAVPALRAALDELERLRAHVDAAGDGLNLAALLDLYRDREQAAVAEVERLRALIKRLEDDAKWAESEIDRLNSRIGDMT